MMTCFVMVKLQHSVRYHGYIDLQRLQDITRIYLFNLMSNDTIKNKFFRLTDNTLTYDSDW